jgi:hypothetical protein
MEAHDLSLGCRCLNLWCAGEGHLMYIMHDNCQARLAYWRGAREQPASCAELQGSEMAIKRRGAITHFQVSSSHPHCQLNNTINQKHNYSSPSLSQWRGDSSLFSLASVELRASIYLSRSWPILELLGRRTSHSSTPPSDHPCFPALSLSTPVLPYFCSKYTFILFVISCN